MKCDSCIGGDGLIRLTHPQAVSDLNDKQIAVCAADNADWFMDYRNADGSLAEMCGNGTRAITLFAQRQGIAGQPGGEPFRLGTRAGVKVLTSLGDVPTLGKDVFQVEMGSWKRSDDSRHGRFRTRHVRGHGQSACGGRHRRRVLQPADGGTA